MKSRIVIIALAWIASLVGVGLAAQGGSGTQAPTVRMGEPDGPVLTGSDIGFQRIAAPPDRDGKVAGRWLVKVNGEWVETTTPLRVVR